MPLSGKYLLLQGTTLVVCAEQSVHEYPGTVVAVEVLVVCIVLLSTQEEVPMCVCARISVC